MSNHLIGSGESEHKKKPILLVLMSLLIIVASIAVVRYAKQITMPSPFEKYVADNPRFVFKTISFRKYLAQGKRKDINSKLFRLQVYQVKATGKYYIDMNNISVVENKTDIDKHELFLEYKSPTYFPVSVDIDMRQEDVIQIDTVSPKPISDVEATKIANGLSTIAGGIGAYVGIKVGANVGSSFGGFGAKLIGGSIGGLTAGLGAKYTVFSFSKNYFVGRQVSNGYSLTEQEEFIVEAKQIMAAEMLDMNVTNSEEREKMRSIYEKEIREQVTKAANNLGWDKVDIQFVYTK